MFRTLVLGLAVVATAGFIVRRLMARRPARFDVGGVSEAWIAEHKAADSDF